MLTLRTPRLLLVAADAESARIEADRCALAQLLGAQVPASWPPPEMAAALGCWTDELRAQPEHFLGWTSWYWLQREPPLVIGYGGFKGLADRRGTVEIGFAVLEPYQRQGYAKEALAALTRWALSHATVTEVLAETTVANTATQRLLTRLGFRRLVDLDPPHGPLRYLLSS